MGMDMRTRYSCRSNAIILVTTYNMLLENYTRSIHGSIHKIGGYPLRAASLRGVPIHVGTLCASGISTYVKRAENPKSGKVSHILFRVTVKEKDILGKVRCRRESPELVESGGRDP